MKLNKDNYYGLEANQEYMSSSQYKGFMKCPAREMAIIRGEFEPEEGKGLKIGSYVDALVEGTGEEFRKQNPDMYTKSGSLRTEYKHAIEMYEVITADEFFMGFLNGEKQKIVLGEIAGVPFKGKLDVYLEGERIVDLKTTASFREQWNNEDMEYQNFAQAWRYDIQGAIYQELIRQETGKKLPFYLATVTSEPIPDKAIIQIPQVALDSALEEVKWNVPKIQATKLGFLGFQEAERCEHCDYCKTTKKLDKVIDWLEI